MRKELYKVRNGYLSLCFPNYNDNKPPLLVCGGGPGIPEYLLDYLYPSPLTKYFKVCYFDYRGTGWNLTEVVPANMTTESYVCDVADLASHLSEISQSRNVYIMGHSFGTYIALHAINRYPQLFAGYLAVSQVCNQHKSELLAYNYMLHSLAKSNQTRLFRQLCHYNPSISEERFIKYFRSPIRDKVMHELGIGTTLRMRSVLRELFIPSFWMKGFNIREKVNIWRGKFRADSFAVVREVLNFNVFNFQQSFDVPIYFFAGSYDYTCNVGLQWEYYKRVICPIKKFFLFENSAHSPIFEEFERADMALMEILGTIHDSSQ